MLWHGAPRIETAHRSKHQSAGHGQALREIINYSRARRTWADPNAMQIDAVRVSGGQERQRGNGNAQLDKGKGR